MSWDKYNEARRKAKKAEEKAEILANTLGVGSKKSTKTTKKSTSKSNIKNLTDLKNKDLSNVKKSEIKSATKNAKTYRWLFGIFALIAIILLCTLPFSEFFEKKINNTIEREGIIVGADIARKYSTMNINYVDVLQGDCILINLPDGKNMIIDAGSSWNYYLSYGSEIKKKIFDYIDENLLTSDNDSGVIDYMIMTHADYDHYAYMPAILERYQVKNIYRPNTYWGYDAKEDYTGNEAEMMAFASLEEERATQNGASYITQDTYNNTKNSNNKKIYSGYNVKSTPSLYTTYKAMYDEKYYISGEEYDANIKFTKAGEVITNSSETSDLNKLYTFTFYSPVDTTKLYSDWNNYSCFIILEYNGLKYCFTGDTEKEGEEDILKKYGDTLPQVDIMDAGHHGSKTSSTQALLTQLKPRVVICSCDDGSQYQHPAQSTLDRFVANGVPKNCIFTTHLNSNICVALNYNNTAETLTEGDVVSAYVVGVTKQGEVTITEFKWWYIVSSGITISGIVLLIVIPKCIKKVKKSSSKLKK